MGRSVQGSLNKEFSHDPDALLNIPEPLLNTLAYLPISIEHVRKAVKV